MYNIAAAALTRTHPDPRMSSNAAPQAPVSATAVVSPPNGPKAKAKANGTGAKEEANSTSNPTPSLFRRACIRMDQARARAKYRLQQSPLRRQGVGRGSSSVSSWSSSSSFPRLRRSHLIPKRRDSSDWSIDRVEARDDPFWSTLPGGDMNGGMASVMNDGGAHGGEGRNGNVKEPVADRGQAGHWQQLVQESIERNVRDESGVDAEEERRIAEEHGLSLPRSMSALRSRRRRLFDQRYQEEDCTVRRDHTNSFPVPALSHPIGIRRPMEASISTASSISETEGPALTSPVAANGESNWRKGSIMTPDGLTIPLSHNHMDFCEMYCAQLYPVFPERIDGENSGSDSPSGSSISQSPSQITILTREEEQYFFRKVRVHFVGCGCEDDDKTGREGVVDEILRRLDQEFERCPGAYAAEWRRLKAGCIGKGNKGWKGFVGKIRARKHGQYPYMTGHHVPIARRSGSGVRFSMD